MDSNRIRQHKTGNFTLIYNDTIKDTNIYNKSLGLLVKLQSLPDYWEFSFSGIVAICKDGKDSVKTQMDELKREGYLKIVKTRKKDGTYLYDYHIYDTPQRERNNPAPDFPPLDNPALDNPQEYNTNKIDKIDKTTRVENNYDPVIKELFRYGYIESNEQDLIKYQYLINEYRANGYDNDILIPNARYVAKKFSEQKSKDEQGKPIRNKFEYYKSALRDYVNKCNSRNNQDDELFTEDDIIPISSKRKDNYER